ncbi:unnamed protein product [Arctia plantaginis]|uniref:Uncharacterized protein n=1 Tax=Arctia plantaginis TaxID=874455 RepID=A0A8S1B295_ARCPL|nr:unnamed protein product [Arctia plantaginis]CAB3256574.1 unnamed protein product [Arctia plantaginis]
MSCGKRPLVKLWDKPKKLRVITPSRYEQNEASVKRHWKNVIKSLEDSYKDDQFWETQVDTVRDLVGPVLFRRIAKIFDLPLEATKYVPQPELSSIIPSEEFYENRESGDEMRPGYSLSDYQPTYEEVAEEESDVWSNSSVASVTSSVDKKKTSKMKATESSKSINVSKSLSLLLSKSFSKCISKTLSKTVCDKLKSEKSSVLSTPESPVGSADDLEVHFTVIPKYTYVKPKENPHFDMLYCTESETDMIKWDSHYKKKTFEVSASDEFSKRAELLTKKIAKEFYDWWSGLGNVEFKSEIKRPEDIEALFQVWFDEHASRGLVLHPKILPCVLKQIADFTMTKKASCPNALKRQLAFDIHAETSPAHTMAFGTSLPQRKKHVPPRNNTKQLWDCVQIPEDLSSMSCVWHEIEHLTSTKAFHDWLEKRPQLPMPPYLKSLRATSAKKSQFIIPSDILIGDKTSVQELALPVSQFTLELKQVLSKLMNE